MRSPTRTKRTQPAARNANTDTPCTATTATTMTSRALRKLIYAARAHSAELRFPTGPVDVGLYFYFPRPKSHYRTGRNSHLLKDPATEYKPSKPDLDKLVRAALDAITQSGRIWRDDAQVAGL